jgi:hypothetical protein
MSEEDTRHYGVMCICKPRFSEPVYLIGSNIPHRDVVSIQINTAKKIDELKRNQFYPENEIVEIYITQEQLIKAIITNLSIEVPVTIVSREMFKTDWNIEHETKLDLCTKEFHNKLKDLNKKSETMIAKATCILENKKMTSEQKKDLSCLLFNIHSELDHSIHNTVDLFNEFAKDMVNEIGSKSNE